MHFDEKVAPEVIKVLEAVKARHTRIRIFLGNTETGENWLEEHDIVGYIDNSTGPFQVPILLHNAASLGGRAILCHCILAIKDKDRWLYKHPLFKVPQLRVTRVTGVYSVGVDVLKGGGWVRQANFKVARQADRYVEFITGRRFSP